jgi:hypothetical protein
MQQVMFMPLWTREEQGGLRLHYLVPDTEGHLVNGGHSSRQGGGRCPDCNMLLEEKKRRKREYH